MRLTSAGAPHLTYCTNIHPGETWKEVRHNLETAVVAVQSELGARSFGVGLRLSALAASQLARDGSLEELRDFLDRNGLYVFTLNGFPYGPFHGLPVKERVYAPDWRARDRLTYTNQLADLLSALLPPGLEGSISTVPGAFKAHVQSDAERARVADHLIAHALHLHQLRVERGATIALALEPEPACMLETIDESVAFFERELFSRRAVESVRARLQVSASTAEEVLRRHLGLCLDACHAAIEFEDPDIAIDRLAGAEIGIYKLQLSAGLRVAAVSTETAALLRPFADDVYLHQVVESRDGVLHRYTDLPAAFAALSETSRTSGGDANSRIAQREWRIHFHVPLFLRPEAPLESTRDFLVRLLARQRSDAISRHLEVETYTWSVLPDAHRGPSVVADIAAELRWVRGQLLA